jgi:Sulfotransferase domain
MAREVFSSWRESELPPFRLVCITGFLTLSLLLGTTVEWLALSNIPTLPTDRLTLIQQMSPPAWNIPREIEQREASEKLMKLLDCINWEECLRVVERMMNQQRPDASQQSRAKLEASENELKIDQASISRLAEDLKICRESTSRLAEKETVNARVLEQHRSKALQRALNGPKEYENVVIFRDAHPALVPMHRKYRASPKWKKTAIADFNIVGLPKAGTSQLYVILTSHKDARAFHDVQKECCMSKESKYTAIFRNWESVPISGKSKPTARQAQVQRQLFWFHRGINEHTQQLSPSNATKFSVNGCLWHFDIELSYHYLKPQDKKYMFIFRDPADWLWAVWNFWEQQSIDAEVIGGFGWTNAESHYRSPELFHELVASWNKSVGGSIFAAMLRETILIPRKLVAMAGRKNVMFIRNEDMLPSVVGSSGGLIDELSRFTGMDRSDFDVDSYSGIRNCNAHKGSSVNCGVNQSSAYAIAGGRDMLPETRTLIYLHLTEECKIWALEFGIEYPDCLHILDEIEPVIKST